MCKPQTANGTRIEIVRGEKRCNRVDDRGEHGGQMGATSRANVFARPGIRACVRACVRVRASVSACAEPVRVHACEGCSSRLRVATPVLEVTTGLVRLWPGGAAIAST